MGSFLPIFNTQLVLLCCLRADFPNVKVFRFIQIMNILISKQHSLRVNPLDLTILLGVALCFPKRWLDWSLLELVPFVWVPSRHRNSSVLRTPKIKLSQIKLNSISQPLPRTEIKSLCYSCHGLIHVTIQWS